MSRIRHIFFRRIRRQMKTLFATSLGKKTAAVSVLVRAVLDDGSVGEGEVPTSFVLPHETVEAISAILRKARGLLSGVDIDEYPIALKRLRGEHPEFCMTLAGLETALFRARLCRDGEEEFSHWGGRRKTLETDITIPFLGDADMLDRWLGRVTPQGFRVYKVKVSGDIEADLRFVQAIRERLAKDVPGYVIRLDGNQGFSARTYLQMLRRLQKSRIAIELFEQPLHKHDWAGLKKVAGRSEIPMILDESVFDADAARRVADEKLAAGVNIKIAKSGIAGSAAILKAARQAGLRLMIGCMTETMTGLSAGIYLAAGSGAFDYVDLDSIHLIAHRVRYGRIAICGCRYVLEDSGKC
jgi:L-alanine-DL-glutamate epimerase-like enolase superfamily enzyme